MDIIALAWSIQEANSIRYSIGTIMSEFRYEKVYQVGFIR